MHICVLVCMPPVFTEARRGHQDAALSFPPYSFETRSPNGPGAGLEAASFSSSVSDLPTSAGVAGTCLFMPGFLHWSQGFELTSSCFCSKCSYLLSHLPNPITNPQPVIAEVYPAHHSATVSMAHACLSVRFSTPA